MLVVPHGDDYTFLGNDEGIDFATTIKEEEYEMNDYCGGVLEEEIADINNCQADGDNNNQGK